MKFENWGRYPKCLNERGFVLNSELPKSKNLLAVGLGRSYGDVCLNSRGAYIYTVHRDCILEFNPNELTVTVQAGISLQKLLIFLLKRGYFLPVVPGTQLVTVGGAIANDIHGKSHHIHGSFGNNVLEITLLRSHGEVIVLRPSDDLFRATVGGIGLTGVITVAKLKIIEVAGSLIKQKVIVENDLVNLVGALSHNSKAYSYTVAWLDLLSKRLRGVVICGDFFDGVFDPKFRTTSYPGNINVVNRLSARLLNFSYFWAHKIKEGESVVDYRKFFFPLDSILNWNKAYGLSGFMQWQGVFPREVEIVKEIISVIRKFSGLPTLAVLKDFGEIQPVGIMSFPKEGFTLAIDFPVTSTNLKTVDALNDFLTKAGGRVYLAKDSRLKSKQFWLMYPQVEEFMMYKDENFKSDMWARLVEID